MVLQRTSDYRFSGYQVPEVPRACRSTRGRGPTRKSGQNHSFDILASVAGKLLEKYDNSLHSDASIRKNQHYTCDDIVLMKEVDEERLSNEKPLEPGNSSEETNEKQMLTFEINPTSKDLSPSEIMNYDEKLTILDSKNCFGDSPYFSDTIEGKVQGVPSSKLDAELTETRSSISIKDEIITGDLMKLEGEPSKSAGSRNDDAQDSFSKDFKNHCPFTSHITDEQLVSRDDYESCLGLPMGNANRRIKKTSETKDWIGAPDVKDCDYRRTDGKVKEVYDDDEKTCYTQEKCQKIYPFKKRKFFYHDPLPTSNRVFNRDDAFVSPDKRTDGKCYTSAIGVSSSMAAQQVGHNSNECNVKLSIKSFKVPELFIDIPTNATVGSLKRTVMEAMTSILGDGLHVGILVQGKKVRDDNKTLIQTGISQDSNRRSTCLTSQQGSSNVSLRPPMKHLNGFVENNVSAVPTTLSTSTSPESKALVTVPEFGMEALAVVPLRRKLGHHECVQRRIRRPFTVSEVEALVRAVEKLGTGRWRDVKFHAFDNAKHRTYVDLKDKWKTLVHTARISPQQRRGEPVPQELLDRVLAAQAYWLHRQSKHRVD
ncbi:Telomere repeat-binding protein 5 [Morus notabilis]|uniref:Telomere repeat-binding protein 5 n=1 Tax=Morus notabilis TaxID=981085 RepID=W9SWF4_9ROSA|nr:Telomere repeat-binding protein 5 [Morus notabilis]